MKTKNIIIFTMITIALLLIGCNKKSSNIKKISVGETILPFTLKTQHDKKMSISNKTKMIIFVFAKSSGHTVKKFLDKQSSDYLTKKNIVFVADVSPMPSLIRKYLAMPDLRKRKYPIMLIYNENFAEKFKNDNKGNDIMIVDLDHLKITNIRYIKTVDKLQKVIKSLS